MSTVKMAKLSKMERKRSQVCTVVLMMKYEALLVSGCRGFKKRQSPYDIL